MWAAEELFSGVREFVSFQMCQGACIVGLITMKRFFSWMGADVIFEINGCCAGEATMRAAVKLFSFSACVSWNEKIVWRNDYIVWNWKVFLRNESSWGKRMLRSSNHNVCTVQGPLWTKTCFFSSNCQVYRLCSCIGCKWRTSFCHSKAPWDGWQSCLFPHSCFFKPGNF